MVNIIVDSVSYPVPSSAADTDWAAKLLAFNQAVAANLAGGGLATWIAPVLSTTWVNVAGRLPAGYYLDGSGNVHRRGSMKLGADPIIWTLPVGYRPQGIVELPCILADATLPATRRCLGWVKIDTAGVITTNSVFSTNGDPQTMTCLDGCTFTTLP